MVKLIDRGNEILVDTSELLKLEEPSLLMPPFAQPFRLDGYDESVSGTVSDGCTLKILSA